MEYPFGSILTSKFSPIPFFCKIKSTIRRKIDGGYCTPADTICNSAAIQMQSSSDKTAEVRRIALVEELCKESLESLEWPAVCLQVSAFASTKAGRDFCRSGRLVVGRSREESWRLLKQTEASTMLQKPLDFSGIEDISGIVAAAAAGEVLGIRDLCALQRTLRSARGIFEELQELGTSYDRIFPLLDILENCEFLNDIAGRIGDCIDCTLFIILDGASLELETIRSKRKEVMEKLESLMKDVSVRVFQAGGVDSPLVTKRRSRMCVGIKASHKSLLPEAVVLSSSSSGATYFMEPREAVLLNNMEVVLSNSEKDEERAILRFLSSEVSRSKPLICHLLEKILELDLACARGGHGKWVNGISPVFSEDIPKSYQNLDGNIRSVDIEGLQHPLLLEPFLKSSLSESFPIPLDIKIAQNKKIVVISGPNTGGKTATMKTLGLASLMSKAGMFLPAKNKPMLPWFNHILADIGDHQSLEQNLSTFSGHVSCIRKILEVVSEDSLVLIDEIGSGTDPSEGVALSTSILLHLVDHVNLALVTTHYSDLTHLKDSDSRFENAAMEFCLETLRPTYRVQWGSSGNSNAITIAESIGLDQKILYRSKEWVEKLLPERQKEYKGMIYRSLVEERKFLMSQAGESASLLSDAEKLYLEIHLEAEDLVMREAALKAKETRRLQREIQYVKSQMDEAVRDFENRLENVSQDQFMTILRRSEAVVDSIAASHSQNSSLGSSSDVKNRIMYVPRVGDTVSVEGLGDKVVTVIEAPDNEGMTKVQYGKMTIRAKTSRMRPVESMRSSVGLRKKRSLEKTSVKADHSDGLPFGPAVRTSKNTVNICGLRVEEASLHLEMAILSCRSRGILFVVHGTGVVKGRALGVLRDHPRVAKFEEESPMNGGYTIVYIK